MQFVSGIEIMELAKSIKKETKVMSGYLHHVDIELTESVYYLISMSYQNISFDIWVFNGNRLELIM